MSDPFLRMPELEDYLGLSRGSIYRLVRTGELARPTKLTRRVSAWRTSQVESFAQRRVEASRHERPYDVGACARR